MFRLYWEAGSSRFPGRDADIFWDTQRGEGNPAQRAVSDSSGALQKESTYVEYETRNFLNVNCNGLTG